MQQLECRTCGTTWEREPQRGRPPVQCPDCKAGKPAARPASKPKKKPKPKAKAKTPKNSPAAPAASDSVGDKPGDSMAGIKVKHKRGKTAYDKLTTGVDDGLIEQRPFASRTSGWCTTYDPAPVAVHDRCDGDLGKYRCPCDCHGWEDTP